STSTGIPPPSGLQAGLDVPDLFDYKAAPDGFHFEVLCRSGVVPVDLAAQQIQRLESHLASQPVQEPDRQAFAVDLSVKVHYVGLDGYLAVAAQGWPMANVGNRPAPLSPDRGKGHIHSVGRNYLILGPQVGRSISELRLSQLAALDNPAPDAVRPAKHSPREIHAACDEQPANRGRADPLPAH